MKKNEKLESGKGVMNAGNAEITKAYKKRASVDANSEIDVKTWEDVIYYAMSNVELTKFITSVSVSDLRKVENLCEYLRDIEKRNEEANEANRKALLRAGIRAFKAFSFPSVDEREIANRKAKARYLNTNGFRVTYQQERDERTTTTFEGGAYFSRPTIATAAGVRTSYNSVEYTKRTAEMLKAKAEAERKAQETRERLANRDSSELLAMLTPSQLASLLEKMKK